jgi:arylsulfatase A-like enzyme
MSQCSYHHANQWSRRRFLRTAAGTLAATVALQRTGAAVETRRPNILWIWSDNLAYGDLGCYGNDGINTPHIDALASEGLRLTQYYVAHSVCSPSRAALLTGRQPWRAGVVDVLRPDGPSGLPADEITLGNALGNAGYATAAFGKWHLGDRQEFLPCQRGFDHFLGLPYSMDMLPTLLIRDNEVVDRLDGDKVQNVTERLTDAAIDWIRQPRDRPFFIYFNHTLPHPPINLPPERRHEERSAYQDALEYMDAEVGRLLAAVDDSGLADNTLVVFSSDNGPMLRDGDTGGLRGRIRDHYEGGLRVPFIARYPGHISADVTIDTPCTALDVFPTLLRVAGGELPDDRVYDGADIWPVLTGSGEVTRSEPFVWVYMERVNTIRDGRWKLHLAHRDERLAEPELYDVQADPQESVPVQNDRADVVERLVAYAREYDEQLPMVWRLAYPVRDPERRPSGVRRE